MFANDIDFQAHMATVHGVHNARILLNFQVNTRGPVSGANGNRRTGVGPPVTTDNGPDFWNCEEEERRPVVQLEEAFPALPTSSRPTPVVVPVPVVRPVPVARAAVPSVVPSAAPVHIGQLTRNQRLAEALDINRSGFLSGIQGFVEELTSNYPTELVEWGKLNMEYLQSTIERRLERLVKEPSCHNVSLRPMIAEEVRSQF